MKIDPFARRRMIRNAALSLFIYALPVFLMLGWFSLRGSRPWEQVQAVAANNGSLSHIEATRFHGYGFMLFIIALGVVECLLGLYRKEWKRNDPWYAQLLWPVFRSNIPGRELAAYGPVVRTDAADGEHAGEFELSNAQVQV